MKHAAFFRNTNLGRPRSPTRVQLEGAFLDAGALSAKSFLTNGTLVFDAGRGDAGLLAAHARAQLHRVCGLVEPVFVRPLAQLAKLVEGEPFAGIDVDDVYECCATFLPARSGRRVAVPQRSKRGEVEVIGRQGDAVFSLSRKLGASQSQCLPGKAARHPDHHAQLEHRGAAGREARLNRSRQPAGAANQPGRRPAAARAPSAARDRPGSRLRRASG